MGLLAGDVGVSQDDPSVRRRGQQWWDRDLGIKHIHPHNLREERKKFLLNRALASSEPCFIKFDFYALKFSNLQSVNVFWPCSIVVGLA